ncbi:ribose-phosphate pyrophosphokinase [Melghirimyces profundicolus]|uniref:Ribose-phosphate pyrophosphokinase n=1 Tax=Melghirimyces profundicolus TaxID=1242148 RepID=A0A2T6BU63_9BACL|nr:ribose-phosphate pyrophosphokinase [Melghirimyces profundicolus]PTX59628.1 ribose-phosphate pyrophosphokinase [Melghirimyces profundicolus]
MNSRGFMLFSGTSNPELAEKMAECLDTEPGRVKIRRFKSGEIYIHYEESVRNADVFLVQTMSRPINDHLMELLLMVDAAKRASARSINAVIPYFGYARQEKKDAPREPISAKVVADLLHTVGVNRVITIDLHAPAIQGFFNIPMDHLTALDLMTEYLKKKRIENPVVVSPDAGRAKTAEKLATYLDAPFAIMMKKRPQHNEASITHIVGKVSGRTPIIIEDIIDTGGTIVSVIEGLREKGARAATVCATHPVFSGDAVRKLDHPAIREVVITDTVPTAGKTLPESFTVRSVAPLLAKAIRLIERGGSISTLFRAGM